MNFAHLHLLLNHFPVIGTILGFGLFAASFIGSGRNLDLRRAGLLVFAVTGFLTIPAYLTGAGAQDMLNRSGDEVVSTLIDRHEGAAFLGLWSVMLLGALALLGLWISHVRPRAATSNSIAVLLCSLVAVGLLARTGNTGGDIRHPEVRITQQGTVVETGISSLVHAFEPDPDNVTGLMIASKWWWAFMMSMHFIGLSLVLGVIGVLDLRILGFAKQLPVGPLQRFLPWAILGLGINIVTGMLAFMGMPEYYTYDSAFWFKIAALMLASLNVGAFYLTGIFERIRHLGPGEDAPWFAKAVSVSSLILWFSVIIAGRYIQLFQDTIAATDFE
jgi:uncharacterized membrane protein